VTNPTVEDETLAVQETKIRMAPIAVVLHERRGLNFATVAIILMQAALEMAREIAPKDS
jgi:hypothetical protein